MAHFGFSRGGVLVTSHLHSLSPPFFTWLLRHSQYQKHLLYCYVQSVVFGTNLVLIVEQLTFLLIHRRSKHAVAIFNAITALCGCDVMVCCLSVSLHLEPQRSRKV